MTTFYPSYLRELFTNRAHELSVLANVAETSAGVTPVTSRFSACDVLGRPFLPKSKSFAF